ncbi:zinc finger, CCHC-type containing protein [Tanacetum coccineum]
MLGLHEISIGKLDKFEGHDFRRWQKKMTTNFGKLDKFEGHDFRRWQKKMHFLLTTLKVVYVLTTPMPKLLEDATVEVIRIRAKWENDDYICRGHILNGMSDSLFDIYTNVESAKELWDSLESKQVMEQFNELLRILGQYTQHGLKIVESISVSSIIDKLPPSWKDFKHTFKHSKDDLSLVQLSSHLRIEESLRTQDSDKGKGKEVAGPSVNMAEEGKNKNNKQNKGKKHDFKEHDSGSDSNKKPKLECWKCGKTGNFKSDCRSGNKKNVNVGGSGKGSKDHSQDQCQNLVPVWNRFIKYSVSLISEAFYVQVNAIAWWIDSGATTHVCKYRCWFKTYELVEDGFVLYMGDDHFAPVPKLGFGYYNNGMFMLNLNKVSDDSDSVYMSSSSTVVNSSLWHARLGHVHYKRMLEMYKDELIPAIDENPDKCTTCMLTKITRQPFKSITRKSVILELIHSDLCDFHATPSLSLSNKKYVMTFIDDASRFCYVYLLHAKDEALDKFRIYKTEVELQQNNLIKTVRTDRGGEYYDPVLFQSVGIIHETTAPYTPQQNGVAERKNRALKEMINFMLSYSGLSEGFWGEAMLTSCYLLNRVPNKRNKTTPYELWDDHYDNVPSEILEPRKGKRVRKAKSYGFDFQLYLVEGSRDQKEAIDDEIGSFMENNTWVLYNLPPICKPLCCKWIFKRKKKVDGTIDKFKARLVIQGFKQKEGIGYFDTYAPVARITTIRLLLALAAIHNLVIHQLDVKTTFLNGDLDEKVYMKQPERFVMPGNEHKVTLSECQEASGSLEDLEIIQEEDTHPSIDTSLNHEEDDLEIDEPQSDIIPIRRSTRTRRPTDRMCLYIDAEEHELGDLGEPANYKAALLDPESDKWLNAMNVEMQSMKDNEVWDLVDLPPNGKTIGSKWLFKKKTDMDGAVHTYKARLVAKGYTQTPGIDYEETFSPVADIRAIRILIAIAAYYDYEIWQMDVKTAFLNGYLSEEVYMEQPKGFVNPKYPKRVCKLKRSIYGLKQASRQWNKRFDDEIKKFGFTQNPDEPCVYLKASGSNVTFLILYVDDILIMGNNIPMLQGVKSYLGRCFAMKDLGEAAYKVLLSKPLCYKPCFVFNNHTPFIPFIPEDPLCANCLFP